MFVGQHQMRRAGPHGILGLGTDPFQPAAQRVVIVARGEGAIDH